MTIVSLLTAFTGLVVMSRRGLPSSLSAGVFELPSGWRWLWSVWLVSVGWTSGIALMVRLGDLGFLGFALTVCLTGVGVTPLAKPGGTLLGASDSLEGLHDVLAVMAGVASQLCVAALSPWRLLAWAIWLPLGMVAYVHGRGVLAAEVACAVSLYGSLLY